MAPTKWTQLGISLGNKCNMLCDHCLPSSSVNEKGFLSKNELVTITEFINANKIPSLSFTGGEPILYYSDLILEILNGLSFDPYVKITTNASFVKLNDDWKNCLSNLSPDQLRISYDQFHSKFLNLSTIERLVGECRDRNIECVIETCINSPLELIELNRYPDWFLQRLHINKVLRAGRAAATGKYFKSTLFESSSLNVKCPFIGGNQIMFHSGRGFSYCCNNLAVSKNVKGVFFESPESMVGSDGYRLLVSLDTMGDLLKLDSSLANDPVNSEACNLCESYFSSAAQRVEA